MAHPFDLTGKHALVTGASSGLGRHFAQTLAAAGAKISVAARRQDALAETVQTIRATGAQAQGLRMDVTDTASVEQALVQAETEFGPIHILVNNAGVTNTSAAVDLTEADWSGIIDTNLTGSWHVAQRAARRMIQHASGGSIINIASILGLRVAGGVMPYAVSKAGLVQMTKALALEWARHRIRVNAIAPGYIETDLNQDFFASDAGRALIRRIPQRRLGEARELDGALLLLASDASSYMTGSILAIDGGHLVSGL